MHLFRTILRTVFNKGAGSLISFFIVMLCSKQMGAVGRGEISLLVLNITVILLFNDLIGGGALVFLIPRNKLYNLLLPAWIWGVCCGLAFPTLFLLLGHTNGTTLFYLVSLSVFLNLSSINTAALNGKEKIRETNIVSLCQVLILAFILSGLIFIGGWNEPGAYYLSLLISYILSFFLSLYFLRKEIRISPFQNRAKLFRQMIRTGFYVQLGNAVQLLNYRISFYLLDYFFPKEGTAMVGVYATGASVCESVWVISNGISMVQYARIANMKVRKDAQDLSISLSKISFLATLLVMIILVLLPSVLFTSIFGSDFLLLPEVIRLLSIGICSFGLSCIYSHYFSGIGKMQISSYSSVVGLCVTVLAGFILVPRYGIYGAALTACCSYLSSAIYLLLKFRNETGRGLGFLLFSYRDLFSSIKSLGTYVRD
jgi:O-antigen/teichoic acid export membrane protein